MDKQAIERIMSRVRFDCNFCGTKMTRAWIGHTPFGNPLTADICPKCLSTRYTCSDKNDPMFQTLSEINCAFTQVWMTRRQRS